MDECADDRLNDCDVPNAECENREPIYDNDLKYVCRCKKGWRGDPEAGYKWRRCVGELLSAILLHEVARLADVR